MLALIRIAATLRVPRRRRREPWPPHAEVAFDFVVHQRRAVLECLVGIDNRIQGIDVDHHQRGRILGNLARFGDHHGHWFAHVADLANGERVHIRHDDRRISVLLGNLLTGLAGISSLEREIVRHHRARSSSVNTA